MRLPLFLLFLASFAFAGCSSPGAVRDPLEVQAVADGQHGESFVPAALSVAVGQTVTFRVVGPTPHTVDFGPDDAAPVAGLSASHSGNLNEGQTFAVTFSRAGTFDYHCRYHLPGMIGTITVR